MTAEKNEQQTTESGLARLVTKLVSFVASILSQAQRDVLFVGAAGGFLVALLGLGETAYVLALGLTCAAVAVTISDERQKPDVARKSRYQLVAFRFGQALDAMVRAFFFVGLAAMIGASIRFGILELLRSAGWAV
jgi:hypothetical protein